MIHFGELTWVGLVLVLCAGCSESNRKSGEGTPVASTDMQWYGDIDVDAEADADSDRHFDTDGDDDVDLSDFAAFSVEYGG